MSLQIKRLVTLLTIIIITTSCGMARFSDVARNLHFEEITSIQLKGFTGIEISAAVVNNSKSSVAMEGGVIELFDNEKSLMTLIQVGVVSMDANSGGVVSSMWRVEGADLMALMGIVSQVGKSNYEGLSIGYSATLTVDEKSKNVSGKRVDVAKILDTFAK